MTHAGTKSHTWLLPDTIPETTVGSPRHQVSPQILLCPHQEQAVMKGTERFRLPPVGLWAGHFPSLSLVE